jgi:uncharacterized protein
VNLPHSVISADSHVAETEDVYADIDPRFRERRPRAVHDARGTAILAIPDIGINIPLGTVCTVGRRPEDFGKPLRWEDLHPSGYDPKARLAIQDEDGIAAEVLYPSIGMALCNHPDIDYKKACFDAYNRWLAGFCATDPRRLVGVGLAAVRSIDEGLRELEQLKDMGFRGVMLPGNPAVEDYDKPCYDPFWEACVDLGLPVSFHILTSKGDLGGPIRGPMLVWQIVTVRGNQNIMMMLVLGGVFERHPKLRVVCVEADAGWVPHFNFRMDHAWERHRFHMPAATLSRMPSEYMNEHVYVTFQDDYSVKHVLGALNMERVLWATDFPHSDGTYPHTAEIIEQVTQGMNAAQRRAVLHDNVARLYGLGV